MMEELSWLGKEEELEFRKTNFRGKNAGKIYKYSNYVDGLIRTRAIVFAMVLLVWYPVLVNYLGTSQIDSIFVYERLTYSFMFLISGLLFMRMTG